MWQLSIRELYLVAVDWRRVQLQNFTSWEKLASFLLLDTEDQEKILKNPSFPLNLPLRLAEKIKKGYFEDPILKQFLPIDQELYTHPLFSLDPVQDKIFRKDNSRILQKYQSRVLLIVSGACAMHCRYCFRKNFDYKAPEKSFEKEIALILKDPSIKEVILSGGDPLSISDEALSDLLFQLDRIDHVKRIRFHTRFPIGIPERITTRFLQTLASLRKQVIFIIHTNHIKEWDKDIHSALKSIRMLGIPLLSQTVLLQGVNNTVTTLQELFEHLSDHGILPYYLHQQDKVQGASHFEVEEAKGKQLMQELSKRLSGYSLPRWVKEEPGKSSKTPLDF